MDTETKKKILIVDDSDQNRKILTTFCINMGFSAVTADDGIKAVESAASEKPDVILMDVMMPVMDGYAATKKIKAQDETKTTPVIMVTALTSRDDMIRGIECGADDFLSKPVDFDELKLRLKNNIRTKQYYDLLARQKVLLEEQVEAKTQKIRDGYIDTIHRLTLAAEYKDEDTGDHIQRISHYTKLLAQKMGGGSDFAETIYYASPMHDIGKVAIPDNVLLKQGPLNDEEWAVMKKHTTIGGKILFGSDSVFAILLRS